LLQFRVNSGNSRHKSLQCAIPDTVRSCAIRPPSRRRTRLIFSPACRTACRKIATASCSSLVLRRPGHCFISLLAVTRAGPPGSLKADLRTVKAAAQADGLDPAYARHLLRAGFATSADRADSLLHRIAG